LRQDGDELARAARHPVVEEANPPTAAEEAAMSTTIAKQPPTQPLTRATHHGPRRALISVAVATALAVGAGAAVVTLNSSDGTTSRQAHPTPTVKANVDVGTLFSQISAMPLAEERIVVAALDPSVRTQLAALVEAMATRSQ
jgi:hypothetical protein